MDSDKKIEIGNWEFYNLGDSMIKDSPNDTIKHYIKMFEKEFSKYINMKEDGDENNKYDITTLEQHFHVMGFKLTIREDNILTLNYNRYIELKEKRKLNSIIRDIKLKKLLQ